MRSPAGSARTLGVLALGVLAVACSDAPPAGSGPAVDTLANGAVRVHNTGEAAWPGGTPWTLVEDLRLGSLDAEGPELFSRIGDVEVTGDGRIVVLDVPSAQVRVFGPDGAFLDAFGREGQGPGEFARPASLLLDARGRVWVVDMGNSRYSIWTPEGQLVEEERRFATGQVGPWPGVVTDDGRVVDVEFAFQDGTPVRTHVVFSPEGEALDTVVLPPFDALRWTGGTETSRTTVSVPFGPAQLYQFLPDGTYLTAITDEYRVVRHDLSTGDTLRIVEKDATPAPVRGEEIDARMEGLQWAEEQGVRLDPSMIPDHHPLIRAVLQDDAGYLWVQRNIPSDAMAETFLDRHPPVFDVFDDGGRYLGDVEAPGLIASPTVTREHMYGITQDSLGVQYVVRLRIQGRGEGTGL